MKKDFAQWMRGRTMAAVAVAALTLPMLGCGAGTSNNASGANLPPIDASRGGGGGYVAQTPAQQPRQGMSTGKKVAILAGAAALYYLYRKHQNNKQAQAGQTQGQPQYYLSKNGRVYYRDQTGRAVYVTPPAQPIEVPYDEIQRYQGIDQLQGYNNQTTGDSDLRRFLPQGGM